MGPGGNVRSGGAIRSSSPTSRVVSRGSMSPYRNQLSPLEIPSVSVRTRRLPSPVQGHRTPSVLSDQSSGVIRQSTRERIDSLASSSRRQRVVSGANSGHEPVMTLLTSMEACVDKIAHMHGTTPTELSKQNRELRSHLHRQDDVIAELSKNIVAMQNQLHEALTHDGVEIRIADDGIEEGLKETQSKTNACGGKAEQLQRLLNLEKCRQQCTIEEWLKESRELKMDISQMKAALMTSHGGAGCQERVGAEDRDPINTLNWISPFDSFKCGANVSFSEGNYTVSRTRGWCQSVSIGSGPLVCQKWGWYFEITVREIVHGWTEGFGIGMTRTEPECVGHVPDKAWQIPSTYVAGYGGSAFIGGIERRVPWCLDGVAVGTRIGVLITCQGYGDFIVFVDDKPVVRVDKAVSKGRESFYPIVDIFAAIRVITLSKTATPPEPPWNVHPKNSAGFVQQSLTTPQRPLHAPLSSPQKG